MQEILNAQDSASYRLALQAHLNSETQIELRKQQINDKYEKLRKMNSDGDKEDKSKREKSQ